MPGFMVFAPMSGWVTSLDEVPDPVFADRILGDGVAVDPTSACLVAPCDGVIAALARHAVTIRAANGAELLVHVGLETVALQGKGFTARVRQGQNVKAGDPILEFDLDFLARNAKSLLSPVIVANGEDFHIARRITGQAVIAGDFLMEVAPVRGKSSAKAAAKTASEPVSRNVVVGNEHGLHARPAALVANAARHFAGEVTLICRGGRANAKSAIAVMALGVRHRDEVTITASGVEAGAAVAAVTAVLEAAPAPVLVPTTLRPSLPGNTATRLHGICAAPGRRIGTVVHLRASEVVVAESGGGLAAETAQLHGALAAVRTRLERAASSGDRTKRDILAAHLVLLDDPEFRRSALAAIEQGKSAAFAWRQTIRGAVAALRALDDARLRERAGDLLDLERQVLAILTGEAPRIELPPQAILIAEEILPSDLAGADAAHVAGFVSAGGGPTSHVAILAAGLNVPALVGAGAAVLEVGDGAEVLLDAGAGFLDLRPDAATVAAVSQAVAAAASRQARDRNEAGKDCCTADGVRIEVFVNLGQGAEEAVAAVRLGAEGCGVLRTEFLFMQRATPPDETEQLAAYQAIADALAGRSFILRTFDIGADKPLPYLAFPPEDNPQLGLRGVRAAQAWPQLLRTQLKAAIHVKPACKIMLPMITSPGETAAIRVLLDALCREVDMPPVALGAMIETPSAALLADVLVREADFLSIGTNDLTQYVLAIDRGHRMLSAQLDALHPAVLQLIGRTAEAARAAGKTAAVCGGLAADLAAAPILIGLGISELSVPAPVIPRLKAAIRVLTFESCRAAAQEALALESPAAVRALVKARFGDEEAS